MQLSLLISPASVYMERNKHSKQCTLLTMFIIEFVSSVLVLSMVLKQTCSPLLQSGDNGCGANPTPPPPTLPLIWRNWSDGEINSVPRVRI